MYVFMYVCLTNRNSPRDGKSPKKYNRLYVFLSFQVYLENRLVNSRRIHYFQPEQDRRTGFQIQSIFNRPKLFGNLA